MGQKKLVRFEAIKGYKHVLQYPEGIKGNWHTVFGNDNPLTLELACGKGEYAVGLAKMNPSKNYLGVDVKGNRIYVGAKQALEQDLKNVAFMRTQIDRIFEYFDPGEVTEIWLTFPDPQLRIAKAKKRLTHPVFLRKYIQFLAPGSPVHLKTDSPVLYQFTKKVIELYGCKLVKDYDDVYGKATEQELLNIKTHYEGLDIAQSGKIYYLQFQLSEIIPVERDEILKKYCIENEVGRRH